MVDRKVEPGDADSGWFSENASASLPAAEVSPDGTCGLSVGGIVALSGASEVLGGMASETAGKSADRS